MGEHFIEVGDYMLRKRIQLGLIHVAVAMTLVPINSTLNRVMIKELALSATLVAVMASLPYLFSPIQVMIGSFSDKYPILGLRRTPYIVLGLGLCIFGVAVAPQAAYSLEARSTGGFVLSLLAFGAWGMGYNFATVSYFSLASEVSGEEGRSRTIATMFFMMIIGIILTASLVGRLVTPYTPANLALAFNVVAGVATVLGILGIVGLESRTRSENIETHYSLTMMTQAILGNRQVTLFFWYLVLLLTAILGQDLLLEPYGAEAFGLPVNMTTQITSIWGTAFLLSLVIAGLLEGRTNKFTVSRIGALGGMISFPIIILSGFLKSTAVFYLGVVTLGLATGLSTVSNLALMLEMTTASSVGLFIGAWGMAGAVARLVGNIMNGLVRDVFTGLTGNLVAGYQIVFLLETAMLLGSLFILRRVDVGIFKNNAEKDHLSVTERAAIAGDI